MICVRRRAHGILVLALALGLHGPRAEDDPPPGPRYGRVVLADGTVLHVELADTPSLRRRGYMFREKVGPEDGMLFLFDREAFHSFWMKNVQMPLDILWMAGDGTIVELAPETPPCREEPCDHIVPLARARYVLELAAGRAAALGLGRGDVLEVLVPRAEGGSRP